MESTAISHYNTSPIGVKNTQKRMHLNGTSSVCIV